jgi:hypothetical protein
VAALGPVSYRDLVNIGYSDPSGDPTLCDATQQALASERPSALPTGGDTAAYRPYACRLLSSVRVLWIDGGVAYLELSPYQAQAIWALQAAGLQLWGERYGVTSDPLPAFDRLDAGQLRVDALLAPVEPPQPRVDELEDPAIPGADTSIPGGS